MSQPLEKLLQRPFILDACSVISLYATGEMDAILRCLPGQAHVAGYVERKEIIHLFNPGTNLADIAIDLSNLKQTGLLQTVEPDQKSESDDALDFSVTISHKKRSKNTGEAVSAAIAKGRQWALVTDDVDALHFFEDPKHGVALTTTLHLVQFWEKSNSLSHARVKQALEKIRLHARYGPPHKEHSLLQWWQSFKVSL